MGKHKVVISNKEINMMKSAVILTTLALSLYGLRNTVAAPIITTDAPPLTSILNSDPDAEENINSFESKEEEEEEESLTSISDDNKNKGEKESKVVQNKTMLKLGHSDESINIKPKTISINHNNSNKKMILDFFENNSILEDYDFTSYQKSLNELINGTQIIPMQLSIWKINIDNLVYSDSEIESLNYHIEGLNNEENKSSRNNKGNYNPSEWDIFFNSIYFTWIKIIFITFIFSIIIKDFIRARRARKPKAPSVYRKSRSKRRFK